MELLIKRTLFAILLLAASHQTEAQSASSTRLFRIYEDNDFLNIRGNGTDNAYTNGTRLDVFYTKTHPSRFFLDRWMPKAGNGSLDIFGWGLTQIMITPNDIGSIYDQPNDYPYAGALYASHSLYSYNKRKAFSFQTELIAGIRGPASFAEQTQVLIHQWINAEKPMGWDHQLNTAPLVNVNFTAEKKFFSYGHFVELIGGGQLAAGSMLDAATLYPLLRIGKLNPYFDGYFSQYSGTSTNENGRRAKTQFYAYLKPKMQFAAYNALQHGTKMKDGDLSPGEPSDNSSQRRLRHRLEAVEFGFVVAYKHAALGYTQTHFTEFNKGLYHHNVGNFTLYITW